MPVAAALKEEVNLTQDIWKKKLFATTLLAGVAGGIWAGAAVAQDAETDEEEVVVIEEVEADDEARQEKVVITGSRIARDSFTSTTPLQVLTGETIAEAGFLDLGEALRSTSVVQGIQLDQQFNSTQVSDAGPGAQSVALRGLDPERTLVVINGRRYAPAGIEGAPSFPDISLIPTSIIARNEILLDGASSVYGSDAIAGVVNIILKDEFDGLEIGGQYNGAIAGEGGDSFSIDFIAGVTGDRGRFMIAGEHFHQEALNGCSRDWMEVKARAVSSRGANEWPDFDGQTICGSRDITEDGSYLGTVGQSQSFSAFPFGAILLGRPGQSVAGIPNFISADLANNFNGLYRLSVLGNEDQMLSPSFDRTSIYATGAIELDEYVPGMEAYTEMSLSNRQSQFVATQGVIGVVVQPDNPYIQSEGFTIGGAGPTANFDMRPLDPTPSGVESELTQYRLLGGLRGDLGFTGIDRLADWTYDLYAGYTRSQGYSSRGVIREEALVRSLNTEIDPETGAVVCKDIPNPTAPFNSGITSEPCIPFNPFFPGLYPTNGADPYFEDPRLLGYLSGTRSSTTFVDEQIFSAYVTGPLFTLPAGDLQGLIGVEYREDAIDTRSDDVTARGLGDGFFVDRPSKGSVNLFEVFGEAVIPVLKDVPGAESLDLELAGRFVNHEFYGENSTYSAKVNYQPVDFVTLRGTYGTSFRAPNLRELFLAGQSGFQAVTDPCEVPVLAQSDTNNDGVLDAYTPGADQDGDGVGDLDGRLPLVLANCQAEGIDPFSLAIGINTGGVETFNAGNTGLDPEESTSYTYGFVVEQPFTDSFDMRFGVTYFNIEIEGSVFEPSAGFLVGQCYTSTSFPNDPFCTRRQRDPATGYLLEIDATPFNIAQEVAAGYDFNFGFNKSFTFLGNEWDFGIDTQATKTEEISETIILPGAAPDFDDDAGEIGNPEWRVSSQHRLSTGNWTFFHQLRMIGEQTAAFDDRPLNCQANDTLTPARPEVTSCYTADQVFYNDISATYNGGDWAFRVGVRNLLDQEPPQLDEDVLNVTDDARNVPVGVGYDRIGRTIFVNVSKRF